MANNNVVLGLAALALCVWAVSLAGLAALQDDCQPGWSAAYDATPAGIAGLRGINQGLPCYRLFRYYWFIIIFQFVATAGLLASLVTGVYAKTRLSWMGWFVMTTLLYFQSTDTFYSLTNYQLEGQVKHRGGTMAAGCLMVSVVNSFLIFAMGMADGDGRAPVEEDKPTAA